MASPAAILTILVSANTSQATTALAKTQGQLKATAATANTASATIGSRLSKGAKYGALGLAGLGAASVKMAIDFDKSMRNVNSIAQLNEKQFKSLEDQVKSLAGKTAQSPKTLAEGLYDLVSSGFDAKQSMKVLKASAQAATAGLTDTATSTKAVAATLNAYRMPANKAKDVSDVLFRTVDRGVISFEELSSTIGNVLPAATTLGVKLPEVGAAIATLTKEGQSGATAVTNINAAMTALFKPSEAMKKALNDIGYASAQSLVQAKGFEGALLTLIKATDGSAESIGALFNNVRAQRAVFGLTGKNAADATKDLKGLQDSAGATQRALDEQSKSVAYMWNKLKAQASALAIDIGDNLIPSLKDMLDILTNPKLTLDEKVAKLGKKLTGMIEEWAPKVAKAGAAIGLAIVKGIWGAFWDSDLLGKLFIGAAALRLFGGPGVFGKLGATIGAKIAAGIAGKLGDQKLLSTIPELQPGSSTPTPTKRANPFLLPIGGASLALAAGAYRKQLIDAIFPDGWANSALHNAFDSSSITTSGGTGGFFGQGLVDQITKTWDGIFGGGGEEGLSRLDKLLAAARAKSHKAAYEQLADWTSAGKKINDQTIWDWQQRGKITADGASFLISTLHHLQDNTAKAFKKLVDSGQKAGHGIKTFADNASGWLMDFSKSGRDDILDLGKIMRGPLEVAADKATDSIKDFTSKAINAVDGLNDKGGKSLNQFSDKAKRMAWVVGSSLMSLASTVTSGLQIIVTNTNKALRGFGVKKVAISLSNVGDAAKGFQQGGVLKLAKGSLVPGSGSGDKVPLHLDGRLAAMVEPGELVSVANRTATERLMAVNKAVPRRQDGGSVPHLAKGGMAAMVALANKYEARSFPYKWGGGHAGFPNATMAVDCSGAVSDILHAGGLLNGAPMVSGALMNWGKPAKGNEPLLVAANPGHTVMSLNGKTFGTSASNPGGGAGWIAGASPQSLAPGALRTMGVAGAIAKIARILLKGPNGPLKDLGQHVLDKARGAANKFISAQMPTGTAGGGDFASLGKKAIKVTASQYGPPGTGTTGAGGYLPGFNSFAELSNPPGSLNFSALGGLPMHAKIRIGYHGRSLIGEKRDVGAGGPGIGGTIRAIDLFNDTADKLGFSGLDIVEVAGLRGGGLVPHLKGGGKPHHGGFHAGPTDPAFARYEKAKRFADHLKKMLGDSGKIARLDEKISNASTRAGMFSSEFGEETGPHELAEQIRLNETLLSKLVMARKLANSGMRLIDLPKGMSVDPFTKRKIGGVRRQFTSDLTTLEGLTGHGGRIFDTQVTLDTLKNTTTALTDNTAKIEDLQTLLAQSRARYAVSQSQYGIFAGTPVMGAFAKGGMASRTGPYLVGERGPEVVNLRGGDKVSPNSALAPVNISVVLYEDRDKALVDVNGKEFTAAVKRVNRKQARSGARVLPGRAGS